jgi:hypothetical protein
MVSRMAVCGRSGCKRNKKQQQEYERLRKRLAAVAKKRLQSLH